MLIRRVTRYDLDMALYKANQYFGGNIRFFDTPQPVSIHGTDWRLRLFTNWAGGAGALKGIHSGYVLRHACWHAHGLFFDGLPPNAIIHANGLKIRPRQPWKDRERGRSLVNAPIMQSELCFCKGKSQKDFIKMRKVEMHIIFGIPREPSKVLSNWDNDVLERFEVSRQRYDDGNPLIQLTRRQ